ncbi:MAG: 30S ribosomal protein S14 [Rhodospirillales bacterium]|nr:30S ribosomal protein S14 [Rhodospirillales bacterium]
MAKVCMIERDKKREKLVKRYAAKRAALKEVIYDRERTPEERFQAVLDLADLPRNGIKDRKRNRCALTGRPRGFHRKFNLSRNMIRELGSKGELPGLVKSSW